ncbi:hypothetical protein AVEN_266465-1 [Araneus ventricosus]|uniref:Uncharacterized protein n=1 Tax=Araneus ventricosus TaxID=182803 RepID=A0A4Y2E235_ARAVE|nr:hypothetical protein AVEN_266465-1 [Araneus ventricosus]
MQREDYFEMALVILDNGQMTRTISGIFLSKLRHQINGNALDLQIKFEHLDHINSRSLLDCLLWALWHNSMLGYTAPDLSLLESGLEPCTLRSQSRVLITRSSRTIIQEKKGRYAKAENQAMCSSVRWHMQYRSSCI